MHGQIDWM